MRMVLVLIFLLAACSTSRVPIHDALPIHWDNAMEYQEQTPQRNAIVKVIRDEGFTGGGCYWIIGINKKRAAHIDQGEQATFYVEPGDLLLEVKINNTEGLCGWDGSPWHPYRTTIQKGETKYFRMGIGLSRLAAVPILGLVSKNRTMYIEPYHEPIDWEPDFEPIVCDPDYDPDGCEHEQ